MYTSNKQTIVTSLKTIWLLQHNYPIVNMVNIYRKLINKHGWIRSYCLWLYWHICSCLFRPTSNVISFYNKTTAYPLNLKFINIHTCLVTKIYLYFRFRPTVTLRYTLMKRYSHESSLWVCTLSLSCVSL